MRAEVFRTVNLIKEKRFLNWRGWEPTKLKLWFHKILYVWNHRDHKTRPHTFGHLRRLQSSPAVAIVWVCFHSQTAVQKSLFTIWKKVSTGRNNKADRSGFSHYSVFLMTIFDTDRIKSGNYGKSAWRMTF